MKIKKKSNIAYFDQEYYKQNKPNNKLVSF